MNLQFTIVLQFVRSLARVRGGHSSNLYILLHDARNIKRRRPYWPLHITQKVSIRLKMSQNWVSPSCFGLRAYTNVRVIRRKL